MAAHDYPRRRRHFSVGWDLIKDIQERDLSRLFPKAKLKTAAHRNR